MPSVHTRGLGNRKRRNSETILHFSRGADLFGPTQVSHCVYQLRAGKVRLSRDREAILDHLTRGDFLGEECLLAPSQRSQIAHCLSPVAVSAFRTSQLLDRVQQDRGFARRLLKNLALRLNRCGHTIRDFVAEPADRRLARLLWRLTPAAVKPASGWRRLRFNLSNAEFARTVGTTRSRISHFMRDFMQQGWLERRGREIWIRREGLADFLRSNS